MHRWYWHCYALLHKIPLTIVFLIFVVIFVKIGPISIIWGRGLKGDYTLQSRAHYCLIKKNTKNELFTFTGFRLCFFVVLWCSSESLKFQLAIQEYNYYRIICFLLQWKKYEICPHFFLLLRNTCMFRGFYFISNKLISSLMWMDINYDLVLYNNHAFL